MTTKKNEKATTSKAEIIFSGHGKPQDTDAAPEVTIHGATVAA
jgi:hypothetical protein